MQFAIGQLLGWPCYFKCSGCGCVLEQQCECHCTSEFAGADQGSASFQATMTAGAGATQSITATDTVNGAITATSSYNINLNAVAYFSVTGSNPAPLATLFPITITARNYAGNVLTSYNGTVALTSSDPHFTNPGPITLANGTASANTALMHVGTDSVTVTDISNSTLTGTGSFTVNPGSAAKFAVSTPSATQAGTPIYVNVTAQDSYGNTATGYTGTVSFTSSDGGVEHSRWKYYR